MVPRRSLALVVAVALAVIASAAAYAGLHAAQERADKNAAAASVYVLKGVVPRDDSVAFAYAQGLIAKTQTPVQFVPAGAVTNLSSISDNVAQYELPPGEIVTNAMFVPQSTIHSIAAERVPTGDVAVSVTTDLVHGVAGLIQPGDKTDILVNTGGSQETFLFQSVPVLAVDTTLVAAKGTTPGAGGNPFTQAKNVITFAVPPAAASTIAHASGIYLALEAAGDASSSSIIDGSTLVPGLPTAALNSPPSTGQRVVSSNNEENTP
jgi:Flp pilus assembly protein CpaB